jgi:hypothetical protein
MRTRHRLAALATTLLVLPLASCRQGPEGKDEAEATAEKYFAAIAAGEFEAAVDLMDPEAFEHRPREAMIEFLHLVKQRLGNYQGHAAKGWRAGTFVAADGKTFHRLMLTYNVRYSQHEADNSLTFLTGEGPPRFVGVIIMSPAFMPGAAPEPGVRQAAAALAGAWTEARWGHSGK